MQNILIHSLHSVSKETHHKFIGFPCDPGSRSTVNNYGIGYFEHCGQEQKQNKILHKVHLFTLVCKRNNFPLCVSFETEYRITHKFCSSRKKQKYLWWETIFCKKIKYFYMHDMVFFSKLQNATLFKTHFSEER